FLFLLCIPWLAFAREKVEVLFFYSPQCKACLEVKNKFLPEFLGKYQDIVEVKFLNVYKPENLSFLVSLSNRFKKEKVRVPAVLVGDKFLVGLFQIEDNLERLVNLAFKKEMKIKLNFAQKVILDKFKEFSFLTIISAGLIDGINPCAFAVIVFFVSFLAVYQYRREEIIFVGSFYILGVFITYLLLGLGIFRFLYTISSFYFLIKGFYYLVAGFCFCLFIFALYDYFKYRKRRESEGLILQLPSFLKKKINLVIGKGLRKKRKNFLELSLVSLVVGFLVSLLEGACTGQVYLPTIFFILKTSTLRLKAFVYLLIYNLAFIAPLIVIFLLSFFGVSSQEFNKFLKKNLGGVKLSMAVLFLILGLAILWVS
ncbi:MAG: hypothetical protein J7K17_06705, partial [Candidatus Omnitrophica bacterium]|nr:hypothetical protein [Candidatus Omnitrophota bacterium]